jgi:hypothetical protein
MSDLAGDAQENKPGAGVGTSRLRSLASGLQEFPSLTRGKRGVPRDGGMIGLREEKFMHSIPPAYYQRINATRTQTGGVQHVALVTMRVPSLLVCLINAV